MNPFDNTDGTYVVLCNDNGQHSLWPATFTVPAGWSVVLPENNRTDCLAYVEAHWTNLRPTTLAVTRS